MPDDDDAGNGGQQSSSTPPETQQGHQSAQQRDSGQQSDGGSNGSAGTDQRFTQADLDRILGDRLARERSKYADYDALKNKASDYDTLLRSQMSDQDKAVDTARSQAKTEAAREFGSRLVDAEIRAATAGRLSDEQRTALLISLDRSWFLTDAGEVDTDKVRKYSDALAPTTPATGGARMGQGRQPEGTTSTLAAGRERFVAKRKRTTT